MNKEILKYIVKHPLEHTLINLKDFRENLQNAVVGDTHGSNLSNHFYETLGECIGDIEYYIKNDANYHDNCYKKYVDRVNKHNILLDDALIVYSTKEGKLDKLPNPIPILSKEEFVKQLKKDIHAYHSIDAEAELSKILLEEIDNAMMEQLNVDKQGLEDLKIDEFNRVKKWLSENANLTDEQQEKLRNAKYKNDDKH